jgi:hypothetical protein
MDVFESARADKRRFLGAAVVALIVGMLVPAGVEAATQKVKVKGVVTVTQQSPFAVNDTTGDPIESQAIPPGGSTSVPGSDGALATQNFSGGAGFIGVIDCNSGTAAKASSITVTPDASGNEVVEAIIMGTEDAGDTGTFVLTAGGPLAALGEILHLTVDNASNPNDVVALPYGLSVASVPVTLACTAGDVAAGNNASAVLIGR